MKRALISALVLAIPSLVWSDETAGALLNRLPTPPGNLCDPGPLEVREYLDQLNVTARAIDANLAKRQKEQKAYVKQHEAEWRESMMRQSGLTQEQIAQAKTAQKSKDRKARAAAKRQLAEQVLQQYADLTIDEAKELKVPKKGADGSRPAVTDERTKAYATQELATAQARVEARTPEEQAADEQKRERLARMAKLAEEQDKLLKSIGAGRDVVWDRMRELDAKAQEEYKRTFDPIDQLIEDRKKEITPLHEAIDQILQSASRPEPDTRSPAEKAAESAALEAAIKPLWEKIWELEQRIADLEQQKTVALGIYCAKYSPPYRDLVCEYVAWARGAQPDFDRYEELENEKFSLQMETPGLPLLASSGGIGFQEAGACVDLLRDVFRYSKEYTGRPNTKKETEIEGVP